MYILFIFFLFIQTVYGYCACEINKEKLGHATWYLLHEIAKQPNSPYFNIFIESLAELYPCVLCRKHFKENLQQYSLYQTPMSMCKFHNHVNYQLGKPEFNCTAYI